MSARRMKAAENARSRAAGATTLKFVSTTIERNPASAIVGI